MWILVDCTWEPLKLLNKGVIYSWLRLKQFNLNPQPIFTNRIQQHIKKKISVTHNINRLQKKNDHINWFIKSFGQNLTSIHGKNPQQTRKRRELHLHDREHLQITTANIFNGEKWVGFPLRSGTRQRCLLSPFFLTSILEVLATAVR